MNDADDLREALAVAVNVMFHPTIDGRVDAIEAVLANPVRRLAILDAMGLDVLQEGAGPGGQYGMIVRVRPRGEHMPVAPPGDPAYNAAGVDPPPDRPRGEATDA